MMKIKLNRIISALLIAIIASANSSQTGLAVGTSQPAAQGKDGTQTGYNPDTGNVAFIGGGSPIPVPGVSGVSAMTPQDQALAIANIYAPQFGLKNPSQDLSPLSQQAEASGGNVVHYQQTYRGVPVLAGELIVNISQNGDLLSMSGEVSQNPTLDVNPKITADEAGQTAIAAIAKWNQADAGALTVSQPKLMIFDESLLKSSARAPELIWYLRVNSTTNRPIREVFLINAQTGGVSLHYSEIDKIGTAAQGNGSASSKGPLVASVAAVLGSPVIRTYTLSGATSPLPGTFVCDQSTPLCTSGANLDADHAQQYALDTYNFYKNHHGRDSINNAGMTIISSVHYGVSYANAYWNGSQMIYGDGFTVEDVVGHELTHGVTDYTSRLFYLYQSGAINESFSDIWGEFIDQTYNPTSLSPASNKWLIGQDLPGGAIRSMSNPPLYSQPDRIGSANFYTGSSDYGGVHTNSGVNNKAAFLMTDGGSFNGQTVTGIGLTKTAAIYYEVQTHLLGAGANYTDLYFALNQACINLTGGADGITSGDCTQVRNAALAVEMNVKPSQTFTPNPGLCPTAGGQPVNIFFDNMESGSANWAYGATTGFTSNWGLVSPGISSPTHSLFGPDVAFSNDSYAAMSADAVLPSGTSYLYFNHVFDLEAHYDINGVMDNGYDGGVLEYSTNQGASWNDAQPLFSAGQNYNTTLFPPSPYGNPLGGRLAFSGASNGMVASRYDLTSLAGLSVRFRWRIGTDYSVGKTGWFVDDVRIYTCPNWTSWAGGVSITSDRSVVPVGRPEIGTQFMTYDGFNSGSTTMYVPMLFKNIWGYDSALYIQNINPNNTANITIKFYDTAGNLSCTKTDTIPILSSHGYWLPGLTCLPSSWVGGVVVTSDQNIVAVGRPHLGSEITTYNGFASGSLTMYVPMLFKNMWGSYDSALYVQNTDPTNTANLTLTFYDTAGNVSCTMNDTIPRLSSHGYWLPFLSCLGTSWVGAVVVTSDRNIVAVGRPHIGGQITTYDGFASGLTTSYVPMMFKAAGAGSYDSALYVQNVDSTNTAHITLSFYDPSGTLICSVNDTIARLSSKGYWLPNLSCLGSSWQGSVKVDSDLGVVTVGRPHLGSEIMTYDGASNGSLNSYVPMMFKNAFGGSYNSTLYMENIDPVNSANISLNFYDVNGYLSCTIVDIIPALGTINYFLPSLTCLGP